MGSERVLSEEAVLGWMLDQGRAGFLPFAPDRMTPDQMTKDQLRDAGADPAYQDARAMTTGTCLMDTFRKALRTIWAEEKQAKGTPRPETAKAARLATQISAGNGAFWMLAELKTLVPSLADTPAGIALGTALTHFESIWTDHIAGRDCQGKGCGMASPVPCQSACPAHIDIPGFMALMGAGDYAGAVDLIVRDNPLPHVCGLICPAPCEDACLRNQADEPINIRPLKAVAARISHEEKSYPHPRPEKSTGKKVAVVGSGPSGLTAGFYLALKGHGVTLFEAEKMPGGMLRYGIPEFRLPRDILDQEIQWIRDAGVEIRTEQRISRLDDLFALGYDAVYLAIGTQLARSLAIEGMDRPVVSSDTGLPLVSSGLDFLKAVNRGENPRLRDRVVVLGGGNVAIDVAMTALRQGGKEVRMVCLEQAHEMPASPDEVRSARAEGILIENGWGPDSIFEDRTGKTGFCIDLKSCTRVFDADGRFSPRFDPTRILSLDVDHVILAIGQAADLTCVMDVDEIDISRGLICVDGKTAATSDPRVFAGGDVVSGPSIAVNAIRAGKLAAQSIDSFLKEGQVRDPSWAAPRPPVRPEVLPSGLAVRSASKQAVLAERDPAERACTFDCIAHELGTDEATREVARCMRCDICIGCGLCELVCSEMGFNALEFSQTPAGRLVFSNFIGPGTSCAGCGACATVCPTQAIQVLRSDDQVITRFTGTPICEQALEPCAVCGRPHATQRLKGKISRQFDAMNGKAAGDICHFCIRKNTAAALKAGTHRYGG